jgi:hypothetical protein
LNIRLGRRISGVAGAVALGDDWAGVCLQKFRLVDCLMERCGEGLAARDNFAAVKIPRSRNHSAS